MEEKSLCFICQDFEKNVGHSTKSCPKNVCKRCGFRGHSQLQCENKKICLICKDFEENVGHQTSLCPKQRCKLCKDEVLILFFKRRFCIWILSKAVNSRPFYNFAIMATFSFQNLISKNEDRFHPYKIVRAYYNGLILELSLTLSEPKEKANT